MKQFRRIAACIFASILLPPASPSLRDKLGPVPKAAAPLNRHDELAWGKSGQTDTQEKRIMLLKLHSHEFYCWAGLQVLVAPLYLQQ
jgi:hypothetical protein